MLICKIKFTRLQRHWKDFPIQQDKTSSNGKPPPPPAKKSGADQSVCSKCHDMFRLSDKELAQTKNIKTFCIRLLQVKRCMKKIKKTHSFCNGIGLMTLSTGVHLKRQYHRCSGISGISASSKSTIFKENRKNKKPQCRYIQANQNLSEPRHCGMFGDPHLRTFFDVRQTCVVAGAWSLLDNDILAVQVTNEVVQETVSESATATTKVKVLFIVEATAKRNLGEIVFLVSNAIRNLSHIHLGLEMQLKSTGLSIAFNQYDKVSQTRFCCLFSISIVLPHSF